MRRPADIIEPAWPAPNGCFIEAPCLVHVEHGASFRQPFGSPPRPAVPMLHRLGQHQQEQVKPFTMDRRWHQCVAQCVVS
jgi:hypothetical protein